MDAKAVERIVDRHAAWIAGDGQDGERANLRGADLEGCDRPHDPPAGWVVDTAGLLTRGE